MLRKDERLLQGTLLISGLRLVKNGVMRALSGFMGASWVFVGGSGLHEWIQKGLSGIRGVPQGVLTAFQRATSRLEGRMHGSQELGALRGFFP